jgi:hypothetical protein
VGAMCHDVVGWRVLGFVHGLRGWGMIRQGGR